MNFVDRIILINSLRVPRGYIWEAYSDYASIERYIYKTVEYDFNEWLISWFPDIIGDRIKVQPPL